MADTPRDRIDPLIARWKKFEPSTDAERFAALEHSPTSELQRLIKEVDEAKTDVDAYLAEVEKRYGVAETGDIGADVAPDPVDARRYRALRSLKQAYDEAAEEIADRESSGEG